MVVPSIAEEPSAGFGGIEHGMVLAEACAFDIGITADVTGGSSPAATGRADPQSAVRGEKEAATKLPFVQVTASTIVLIGGDLSAFA